MEKFQTWGLAEVPDVLFQAFGNQFYIIWPRSDKAKKFMEAHVDAAYTVGEGTLCAHPFVGDIMDAMIEARLIIKRSNWHA